MTVSDLENRFSHLLQPIRDLTKNWDVDISAQLEEYLEEIEKISISFDGGATTMNFAEAALLIQGSACVYSKKVEYLYTLVYQVLDLLSSKKRMQQAASVDQEGQDKDANFPQQEDDEFLTLDDIKEHKNIDMRNDEDGGGVKTIPRIPMALVAQEEAEKGENPLLSRTGEVLGSRMDFKMNTCNIHASGTMLLDLSHLSLLENSFKRLPASTPKPVPMTADPEAVGPEDGMDDRPGNIEDHIDEGLPQDLSMDIPEDDGGLDGSNPVNVDCADENEQNQEVIRRSERERKKVQVFAEASKPTIDPWQTVDQHEADGIPERAFKKGKTSRIPEILVPAEVKKRKRKTTKKEVNAKVPPISDFISKAFYSCSSKFSSNPLKVPSCAEFENLYWTEFKRRQAKQRENRKTLRQQGRFAEAAEQEQEENEEEQVAEVADILGDDDDDDNGGVDDDHHYVQFEAGDLEPRVQFADAQAASILGMGDVDQPLADDAPVVNSYEEMVKQYVEGFLATAQQYAQITELSRRVSEWEDKIIPKLKEEEEHGPFDIHQYGTVVLDAFTDEATELIIPFRDIAQSKPAYKVSRLFLATLQLANNYNVKIGCKGKLEEAVDTMYLSLLSKRRHFEELAEYRAPSFT